MDTDLLNDEIARLNSELSEYRQYFSIFLKLSRSAISDPDTIVLQQEFSEAHKRCVQLAEEFYNE